MFYLTKYMENQSNAENAINQSDWNKFGVASYTERGGGARR